MLRFRAALLCVSALCGLLLALLLGRASSCDWLARSARKAARLLSGMSSDSADELCALLLPFTGLATCGVAWPNSDGSGVTD